MRVVQVSKVGKWSSSEISKPRPNAEEVLVAVHAAGVTPSELVWYPTTHTADGSVRESAVPGHEFSGMVEAVGTAVLDLQPGDAVYGMNDWFAAGATADFCVAKAASLALKPESLSHERAATTPIGALTAWQGLLDRARLQSGERVLVHGGAGAVGLYAVQLAHIHGAHVIATASEGDMDLVRRLGADE